jgi:hypothetical protein
LPVNRGFQKIVSSGFGFLRQELALLRQFSSAFRQDICLMLLKYQIDALDQSLYLCRKHITMKLGRDKEKKKAEKQQKKIERSSGREFEPKVRKRHMK